MKVLLVGPYPPPHGGVSVHVASAREELRRRGIRCRILNVDRRAPESPEYLRVRGGMDLVRAVLGHSLCGWITHVHNNGHTLKGWLIALASGIAGRTGPGSVLTLHSGMTPDYLNLPERRVLARIACSQYGRVICVSPEIRDSIALCGVPADRLEIIPAYLSPAAADTAPAESQQGWLKLHAPLLSSVLLFRHEYGFDVLLRALARLKRHYPHIGLAAIGGGEDSVRQGIADCGLESDILLLGDVPHKLCLSWISRSDLFVRATRADGDSISVREALALGKAVVASDVCVRPPGVVLFKSGDAEHLADRIHDSLSAAPGCDPIQDRGYSERLLEIYCGGVSS